MVEMLDYEKLRERYIKGVRENVQKYIEHAEERSDEYVREFYPYYEAQVQASEETADLEGYERLRAYAEKLALYGSQIKRAKAERAKAKARRVVEVITA